MTNSPVMDTTTTLDSDLGRCLQLKPTLSQLGLEPVIIGVGRVVLGSGPDADVLLPVEGVAARHVEIHFDGESSRLKALSPLTWVNDGPVREVHLESGDVLTLGPVEYKVSHIAVPAPPQIGRAHV